MRRFSSSINGKRKWKGRIRNKAKPLDLIRRWMWEGELSAVITKGAEREGFKSRKWLALAMMILRHLGSCRNSWKTVASAGCFHALRQTTNLYWMKLHPHLAGKFSDDWVSTLMHISCVLRTAFLNWASCRGRRPESFIHKVSVSCKFKSVPFSFPFDYLGDFR